MERACILGVAAAVAMAVGCLGPGTAACPGGGLCPPGLVCRLDLGDQICVIPSCGNGVVEAGEACDDGNNDSDDACPGDCVAPTICGNGQLDLGEDCDDGNNLSGDGCQSNCRFPVYPAPRYGATMAYDRQRGVLVLFGGQGIARFGDTWEWDGVEWIERHPPRPLPRARTGAAMFYDPLRGHVVMFGGFDVMGTGLADTWEWDGEAWHELVVAQAPPGRGGAAVAFDTNRGVAVLFGGSDFAGPRPDTWEWGGGTWTERTAGASPPARVGASMAYDPAQGMSVLFGGVADGTWIWSGAWWGQLQGSGPPPRHGAGMAYDAERARTVLFGGGWYTGASGYTYYADVWELDFQTWIQVVDAVSPSPRSDVGMAYVDGVGVVLFGGTAAPVDVEQTLMNDTWVWRGRWQERL